MKTEALVEAQEAFYDEATNLSAATYLRVATDCFCDNEIDANPYFTTVAEIVTFLEKKGSN